ncbi:FKBP12-associated protein [Marasmius tenuissimus]|nr:FKBP12-associated protein [Marasmius tenuissimus]
MDTPGSSSPSILNPVAESSTRNQRQPRQAYNKRKPRPNPSEGSAGPSDPLAKDASKPPPRQRAPRRDNKPVEGGNSRDSSKSNERGTGKGRGKRPPNPRPHNAEEQATPEPTISRPPGQGRRKGIKFGGQLTSSNEVKSESSDTQSTSKLRRERYRRDPDPQEDDLTSNLIRGLRNPPYADCPICFNSIHPPQPTWSCSPLTPIVAEEKAGEIGHEDHEPQYCWTTFHLKCIKSWSEKSYNDVKAAWAARGEEGRGGEWRCPGCQGRRKVLTHGYW